MNRKTRWTQESKDDKCEYNGIMWIAMEKEEIRYCQGKDHIREAGAPGT